MDSETDSDSETEVNDNGGVSDEDNNDCSFHDNDYNYGSYYDNTDDINDNSISLFFDNNNNNVLSPMNSSMNSNKENRSNSDDDDMEVNDNGGMDVNDGSVRFRVYRARFDDGLEDQFHVNVMREGDGEFSIDIVQSIGLYSQSNNIHQILSMTSEQWKNFQNIMMHFMAMLGLIRHDPSFQCIGFHVVGLIHADVFMVNGLPSVTMYQGQRGEGGVIRRLVHSTVEMSFEILQNLQVQLSLIDRRIPEIEVETACYEKYDHQNMEGAMACRNCNPWGDMYRK